MPEPKAKPFPIVLEVEFLDRLAEPVRDGRARSVSEIIRRALERFNFENIVVVRPSQLVISVRLPVSLRQELKRVARAKHTSIGQLVRAAVESYLPLLEEEAAGQLEIPIPAEAGLQAGLPAGSVTARQRRRRRPARRKAAAPRRGRPMTRKRRKG